MTQYMMRQKKDWAHLSYALNNYHATFLRISPFSLGNSKLVLAEDLEDKILRFTIDDGLRLFTDKELVHFPLKKYHGGFKLEYQDYRGARLLENSYLPDDPRMDIPSQSVFRNVIDDSLIEIGFEGKILLVPDNSKGKIILRESYWTIKKI